MVKRLTAAERVRIGEIFDRLAAANPEPKGELRHESPFQLLVSVVLSAQATDASVNKATAVLFPIAGTPEAILALGEAGLTPFIASIGLYKTKAKNVIALSRAILEDHGGAGAPEARGAAGPSRRRPQDRQRGAQRAGRRGGHRRRHPRLPRLAPAEALQRQRRQTRWRRT